MYSSKTGLILLTGASGFIGSQLLRYFLDCKFQVRLVTRHPLNWPDLETLDIFIGDFTSTLDWTPAVLGVHVVVNIAAEIHQPDSMESVNFYGPSRLLAASISAGVGRWVQLSSVGAYGSLLNGLIDETTKDHPSTIYEMTKSRFDNFLIRATSLSSLEYCILRPSNVYGPNMRNQTLFFLLKLLRLGFFPFIGPPGASANYVHVNDVVQALKLCIQLPQAANQIFIVSCWATIEDMISGLSSGRDTHFFAIRVNILAAVTIARIFTWVPLIPSLPCKVRALTSRTIFSTRKIEDYLGWHQTISVKIGMQRFAREVRL